MNLPLHTPARRGRLPAYARELPALDALKWVGLLFVLDDFKAARHFQGAPRIVITPADNPFGLDLRCAERARVYLLASTWGAHIMPTVEALALAGAREIIFRGPDGEIRDAFTEGRPHAIWSIL